MDERNSEADRLGDSAEPTNRQSEFDLTGDREKQRRAGSDLAAIQAGLDSIAAGIQNAEGHNRTAREFLDELEQETGRSQPEAEILGSAQNAHQQSGQSDNKPRNFDYPRQQSENELEL